MNGTCCRCISSYNTKSPRKEFLSIKTQIFRLDPTCPNAIKITNGNSLFIYFFSCSVLRRHQEIKNEPDDGQFLSLTRR